MTNLPLLLLGLAAFDPIVSMSAERDVPAQGGPTIKNEVLCDALKDPAIAVQCHDSVKAAGFFRISHEELEALGKAGAYQNLRIAANPAIRGMQSPTGIDSTITVTVHGADTTRAVTYSKREDNERAVEALESSAASLRFMAWMSGLSLAAGVLFTIILSN